MGKHDFVGQVAFNMFRANSAVCDRRKRYYPLVIQATCMNQSDPNYSYTRILYLDFNLASAAARLVQQKIVTRGGVFTLEEAFGLNSNRTDAEESQRECVICLTLDKNTLFKPCKHVATCFGCAQVIMASNRECPICRQTVSDIMTIDIAGR